MTVPAVIAFVTGVLALPVIVTRSRRRVRTEPDASSGGEAREIRLWSAVLVAELILGAVAFDAFTHH